MHKEIGSAEWLHKPKEVKMFQNRTLNTNNPFAIVIGISVLGLLVILVGVSGISPISWAGASDRGDVRKAVVGQPAPEAAYVREHGSLVRLTGQIEPVARYEGSLAALTGQVEAAPRYEGSLAALTGQVEAAPKHSAAAWMREIPAGFGSLARVTGAIAPAPRYEGSLAALTGQVEPVAKFEGSLVELTGPGRSPRMSQSEYESKFGPIVKLTG